MAAAETEGDEDGGVDTRPRPNSWKARRPRGAAKVEIHQLDHKEDVGGVEDPTSRASAQATGAKETAVAEDEGEHNPGGGWRS